MYIILKFEKLEKLTV